MDAALGRDEHEYSAVDNYNVWILTVIYAGLLLAAVQQMLVSVTRGNSRKSFHFVFLAITAAWLPLRLFIFFATQEDVSTWPEIIWLLPTSIQFCGFALWVLFFADVTAVRATGVIGGIAGRIASGPRSPPLNRKGLTSLARQQGGGGIGGSALGTPFLSGRAGVSGGRATSPQSRGGSFGDAGLGYGYGGSALSSIDDDDDDDDGLALGAGRLKVL
ncbi:hypothetical protein FNF27_00373 [Cafeteria roenbergensis]|uniref:Uncharacterized protein n=1 Tax=Cafeteria roenbergensis TaxID=33653 RepID=A0A5A8EKV0_CAFRO|nr:hypothetical protein FNF27_00373 [Cafeteria roenbergensis]